MISFKEEGKGRLRQEFDEHLDDHLMAIVLRLGYYWLKHFEHNVLLTCIRRTIDENTNVGGNPKSKHMLEPSKAVDIRSFNLTEKDKEDILTWFNQEFSPEFTLILEHKQNVEHFHLQRNV